MSCSNDTTIKIWQLKELYEETSFGNERRNIRSLLTLDEDYDYVRAIDYSQYTNYLFSAADNGIVRKWDINVGLIIGEQQMPIEVSIL